MTITHCISGHPTRERQPGEWQLACGCEASTATDQAIQTWGHGDPDDFRRYIATLGPSPS